jgi:hypothetical protein
MVAISRIIAGEERPYGLFHITSTPLPVLQKQGLRADSRAVYAVHRLIERLRARLAPLLEETAGRDRRVGDHTYPLELSVSEQLSIAPTHYSAVVLALTPEDAYACWHGGSEPERKARALVDFARRYAPRELETISRLYATDTEHAMDALHDATCDTPHLLRLCNSPPESEGYFALLVEPWLEVQGLLRSYDRGAELRPEARVIWFNGTIPFSCLDVLPMPASNFANRNPS